MMLMFMMLLSVNSVASSYLQKYHKRIDDREPCCQKFAGFEPKYWRGQKVALWLEDKQVYYPGEIVEILCKCTRRHVHNGREHADRLKKHGIPLTTYCVLYEYVEGGERKEQRKNDIHEKYINPPILSNLLRLRRSGVSVRCIKRFTHDLGETYKYKHDMRLKKEYIVQKDDVGVISSYTKDQKVNVTWTVRYYDHSIDPHNQLRKKMTIATEPENIEIDVSDEQLTKLANKYLKAKKVTSPEDVRHRIEKKLGFQRDGLRSKEKMIVNLCEDYDFNQIPIVKRMNSVASAAIYRSLGSSDIGDFMLGMSEVVQQRNGKNAPGLPTLEEESQGDEKAGSEKSLNRRRLMQRLDAAEKRMSRRDQI